MIYNFLPEILLSAYITCALSIKSIYNKEINNSWILLVALFACFINIEETIKSDFLSYKYYEPLLKLFILFACFVICHFMLDKKFEKQLFVILSCLGSLAIISSNDFIYLLFAMELAIIPTYFSAYSDNFSRGNKIPLYFVYGIISTSIFVFAVVLIYHSTGATNFWDIRHSLSFAAEKNKNVYFSFILILISFSIKFGIFLCHAWVVDITEQESSQIAVIFCSLKIAMFLIFYKITTNVFYHLDISDLTILIACASMLFGSVMLALQNNIKKIIAYSNIYHAGVVLMCCSFKTYHSAQGIIFFSISELISLLGIFILLTQIKKIKNKNIEYISDLYSLSSKYPLLAISVSVLFLSFVGFPPFIGFWSKFYICLASLGEKCIFPVAIYLISTAISIIFLIKIMHAIWFKESNDTLIISSLLSTRVIFFISLLTIASIPIANKIVFLMKTEIHFAS